MRSLSFHKGKTPYQNEDVKEIYNETDPKATHIVGTLLDVWLKHRCIAFKTNVDGKKNFFIFVFYFYFYFLFF